ncbi:MAG: hypothetical protein ABL907_26235, partial [Hyphomicrobium sp.]
SMPLPSAQRYLPPDPEAVRRAVLELSTDAGGMSPPTQKPMDAAYNGEVSCEWNKLISPPDKYRYELRKLPAEEIQRLVLGEREKHCNEILEQLAKKEAALFFNLPSAQANFEHYCKCANWTLDECIALSLAKEPRIVNWKTVQPYVSISPFARKYTDLRDLTLRAKWAGQLFDPVFPIIFLAWAKQWKIDIPDALLSGAVNDGMSIKSWQDRYADAVAQYKKDTEALTEKYGEVIKKWHEALAAARAESEGLRRQLATATSPSTIAPEEQFKGLERNSAFKLISAMSIVGYTYDPRNPKNTATAEIRRDLEGLGIGLDDGTILKYLKAAAKILPSGALESAKRRPRSRIR